MFFEAISAAQKSEEKHTYLTGQYPEKSAAYEPVKSYFKPIDVKLVFIYFFDYFEVIFQV